MGSGPVTAAAYRMIERHWLKKEVAFADRSDRFRAHLGLAPSAGMVGAPVPDFLRELDPVIHSPAKLFAAILPRVWTHNQ